MHGIQRLTKQINRIRNYRAVKSGSPFSFVTEISHKFQGLFYCLFCYIVVKLTEDIMSGFLLAFIQKGKKMDKKFTFQGHTFDDEKQLIAAKKEAEAVEYLRSKTDFGNMNNLRKLYDRILDRDMMETVIGIDFLKEIRETLISSGMFKEDQIRPVPLLPEVKKLKKRQETQKRSRERTLLERSERQNTILKTVCFFLVVIVIAMFVIVLTGTRSPLAVRYEEQILNKYASWAEELQEKEYYLREYVRKLEAQGIEVPGWETEPDAGSETEGE